MVDPKNLPVVTSHRLFQKIGKVQRFHPEGLYSEKIFGPVQDWTCYCPPDTYVVREKGKPCPVCGVPFTSSFLRRKQFAKIVLPVKIVSGAAYLLIQRIQLLKKIYNSLLNGNYVLIHVIDAQKSASQELRTLSAYSPDTEKEIERLRREGLIINYKQDDPLVVRKTRNEFYYLITNFDELFEYFTHYIQLRTDKRTDELFKEEKLSTSLLTLLKLIKEDKHLCDYVLVLPPAFRPILEGNIVDPITVKYQSILIQCNIYKNQNLNDASLFQERFRIELQKTVDELRELILQRLRGKEGALRGTTGKRVDWSMRGVIVPADCETWKVRIPFSAALEIFKLDIVRKLLVEKKVNLPFHIICHMIDKMKNGKPVDAVLGNLIKEAVYEIAKDEVFILNRQPTLHRGSMWALKPEIAENCSTIGLPKLLCEPLNADFDGDTVALIRVLTNKNDIWAKMSPISKSAITNVQDLSCHLKPKQDIIYSLYLLSRTPEGLRKIEEIVPPDILKKYLPLNKKNISELFLELSDVNVFDRLRKLADEYTLQYPITMGLLDFIVCEEQLTNVPEKTPKDNIDIWRKDTEEEYNRRNEKLNSVEKELREKFSLSDVIDSGARGNYTQLRQMVAARGYVTSYTGEVYKKYIGSSYLDGLTPEELVISAKGTRKALIDQNSTISKSGYLYRKLCFSVSNAIVGRLYNDCSKDTETSYISVEVPGDPKLAQKFLKCLKLRVWKFPEANTWSQFSLKPELEYSVEELLGKTIQLRSPISCLPNDKNEICKTCYPLYSLTNSRFVGIIAAQSVSERTTQLSLRTFHTGGVAKDVKGTGTSQDIANTLKYVLHYFDSTKMYDSLPEVISEMLFIWELFSEICDLQLLHLETITRERLYVLLKRDDDGKKEHLHFPLYLRERDKLREQGWYVIKYVLFGVKTLPMKKSKTLGLLFENPTQALVNILNAKVNGVTLKPTALDKIYLYMSL